jgi:hypothetical protein
MEDLPQYVCKETKFIGYVAFYKGKKYTPFTTYITTYTNGYVFIDEYGQTQLYTYTEVDDMFELYVEHDIDFKVK